MKTITYDDTQWQLVPKEAVLAALDALGDDAAAHIFPDDLEKCSRSECVVMVTSVRAGSQTHGHTVPLFSREQVATAINENILDGVDDARHQRVPEEEPEPLHASVIRRIWKECKDGGFDFVYFAWRIQSEAYRAALSSAPTPPAQPAERKPQAEAVRAPDDFPPRIMALLRDVADRNGTEQYGPWQDGNGEPLQDDAEAALAWIAARPKG